MTDNPHYLTLLVDIPYQPRNVRIASQLVRSPPAGDHDSRQLRGVNVGRDDVCLGGEGVLAGDRLQVRPNRYDLRAFLLQPHHGHPVLKVLEPLGDQYGYLFAAQPHNNPSF